MEIRQISGGDRHHFIRPMNKDFAIQILNWKYESPYDFYNNSVTDESVLELLRNSYFVILDQNDSLIGFFCLGESAQVPAGQPISAYPEGLIDLGIGMKPELTGRGYGSTFLSFILRYIQDTFNGTPIRLTVAAFNLRAIRLYEKLGFSKITEFTNGSADFFVMVREEFT